MNYDNIKRFYANHESLEKNDFRNAFECQDLTKDNALSPAKKERLKKMNNRSTAKRGSQ